MKPAFAIIGFKDVDQLIQGQSQYIHQKCRFFGFWVLGFGFWVLGFGFWVLGFGFWVLGNLSQWTPAVNLNMFHPGTACLPPR
jgi:hypothetical protein